MYLKIPKYLELNDILLNDRWVKEKVTGEIRNFEINENKNIL